MLVIDTNKIRWINERHVPQIQEIDKSCGLDPALTADDICCTPGRIVLEDEEEVLGFMLYEPGNLDSSEWEVLRFGVLEQMRRIGNGTTMFDHIKHAASHKRRCVERIKVRIPESLTGAMLFLQKQGFVAKRPEPGSSSVYMVHEL